MVSAESFVHPTGVCDLAVQGLQALLVGGDAHEGVEPHQVVSELQL